MFPFPPYDELRDLIARGDPQRWLRPGATKGGEESTWEWTVVPLRDRRGSVAGLAALVQEPLAGRDRFALALEASGDGAWDWELRTKRLWVSDSWRAIAGVAQLGDEPSAWTDRIHPADREHFDMAERTPVKWGEMGWILETNRSMNRGMEAMGGRIVKRYRVYERLLEPSG